jgi:alkylation response protein AidB-like acyl-CoA dehydrogenase
MLADAGLYRLLTPQALGGHEAPPASFYLVVEQLAHADAAAAWCCFISCTSALLAAYLPEETAATLFQRPDLKLAGVFAPRGRAVPAEQHGVAGHRVSGRWFWGSGARHADLVGAGCLVIGPDGRPETLADGTPRVLSVVFDRSQVTVLDNWDTLGLRGTGSGEFEVHDVFVPAGRSASLLAAPRVQTPLYRFPVFGLLAIASLR